MECKLGRRRHRLKASDYFNFRELPRIPSSFDYSSNASVGLANNYMNDELGLCTISSAAQLLDIFLTNSGHEEFIASDESVIDEYSKVSGYVRGDSSTDRGSSLRNVLRYWRCKGLWDYTIYDYVFVNAADSRELVASLWLFEGLYFGVDLPALWAAQEYSNKEFTWEIAGDPVKENGHCFIGDGFRNGKIQINSWGTKAFLTLDAAAKYASSFYGGEAYIVLFPDTVQRAMERAPSGFDFQRLRKDSAKSW